MNNPNRVLTLAVHPAVSLPVFLKPTLSFEYERYPYKQKTDAAIAEEEARSREIEKSRGPG